MSRVAKNPIEVIEGVTVVLNDGSIKVTGKNGEMDFDIPKTVSLEINENIILLSTMKKISNLLP